MDTKLALAAIEAVDVHHRGGHTCHDGQWYNDITGTRTYCPPRSHLLTARRQVTILGHAVGHAANSDRHRTAVAEGMTGLTMADLQPEDRDGWLTAAGMAIAALAQSLERDTDLTARAQAAADRVGGS